MKLEIKNQNGTLTADQPKFRQAILMILLGIIVAFIGALSAILIDYLNYIY